MAKNNNHKAKVVETHDETPESLDKVRDILLGGQMRTVETRLRSMEERLHRDQQSLRAEVARQFGDLDAVLRKEVATDGTRRETFDQIFEIGELVQQTIGEVPAVVALNKIDLTDAWVLGARDDEALARLLWHRVRTSAKTGEGVEAAFQWIARAARGAAS